MTTFKRAAIAAVSAALISTGLGTGIAAADEPVTYMPGARTAWADQVKRLGPKYSALVEKAPVAEWVGGGETGKIRSLVSRAKESGTMPIAVLYNIPNRDMGSHSGGGASGPAEYLAWIDDISAAIGDSPMVVIVEPDALAHAIDAPAGLRKTRYELLARAVKKLESNRNAEVYLDAGHAKWRSAAATASALESVAREGVAIPGISLNVSNFQSTDDTKAYVKDLDAALGTDGYKVMIDTSRNGNTPKDSRWCNPPWQKLGGVDDLKYDPNERFETAWIKVPGESDGECGIAPHVRAGTFSKELLDRQIAG